MISPTKFLLWRIVNVNLTVQFSCLLFHTGRMEGTNFVPSAGKGCHIAHYSSDWIVSYTAYDKGELGVENDEDVPEISVDLGLD